MALPITPMTFRTATGFGQATNLAVVRPLQQLSYPLNPDNHLMSILGYTVPSTPASRRELHDLPEEMMLEITGYLRPSTHNTDMMKFALTSHSLIQSVRSAS
jgi:hypothetical protein